MIRSCFFMVVVFVMACSTVVFSQVARTMTKGCIAQSHDGNAWDNDDQFASAMDWAFIAAFGYQKHYRFHQHSVVGSGCNNESWHQIMLESARGWKHFPGFDSSIVFDAWPQLAQSITFFQNEASKLSANNPMYFCLSGPMELPWRCLNAVSAAQRAFITCVSHSTANDDMGTCPTGGGTSHKWGDIGALVKTVHISDQNANLGGGKNWSWLTTAAGASTMPAEALKWLKGQDKKNGDCSDAGMIWYVLTGSQKGSVAEAQARFANPLPMDGGTDIKGPAAVATGLSNNHVKVTFSQSNRILMVKVNGMQGDGSITIHNILGQKVCETPMVSGQAQLALGATTSGKYFATIESKGLKVQKDILLN